jgi:hypothetical protein
MFAVDVLHGLWRHSSANHRRETIAFARRANAIMERGYLFAVWRNFVKARTERHPEQGTRSGEPPGREMLQRLRARRLQAGAGGGRRADPALRRRLAARCVW